MDRDSVCFSERRNEELRLLILCFLVDQIDYTATDSLIFHWIEEQWMQPAMADVRLALAWLNEEGLVVTQRPGGRLGLTMATITERGVDVAKGARIYRGVARKRAGV